MNWAKLGITSLLFSALALAQQPEVVITGLLAPQKVILTSRGNMLVTETSMTPNSARVSYVTRSGSRRSLFENMPSGTEVVGGGSGPTAMALRGRTLYLGIGSGDSERRTPTGTSMFNPAGQSSPIFCSILEVQFSVDVDSLNGTFKLTTANQWTLADGGEVTLDDGAGGTARIKMLVDLPDATPDPNVTYRFSNPWGMALTDDGQTLYVTDASTNALITINTATGKWARIVRFPPVRNTTPVGPPVTDAVPTSVRLYDNQVLVSFLTGFPFVPGNSFVLAVTPATGATEPFIASVTSTVDVLWRPKADGTRQFFTLEFSTNQSANPAPPGRLIRYDSPAGQVVAADLRAPVSLAYDADSKDLYVLELSGRLLRWHLD
jgi:hypothetical protein